MYTDKNLIEQIRQICTTYPKQFSKILHAKNNTQLLNYINNWCRPLEFDGISFATKVYYTINEITSFPICHECKKQLLKNVYRLFNPRLMFCNSECKHRNTIRTVGINRVYHKKPKLEQVRKSTALIIPIADDYTEIIKELVKKYPRGFVNIFRHHANNHVITWLDQKFPQLNHHKLQTKINWILHDIMDFPVCECCGKKLEYNINPTKQYSRFCSRACICKFNAHDQATQKKIENTIFKTYGVRCVFQLDTTKQKGQEYLKHHKDEMVVARRKTKNERYSDPGWNNLEQMKKTKTNKYGDPYWNNSEKGKLTYQQHCKSDPTFVKRKTLKTKATKRKRYNDENYNNNEQGKLTRLSRYGHSNPAHGTNEPKVRCTVRAKYGVDYVSQNPDVIKKARSKYTYEGINFDSSTELYVYVFLKILGTDFIYKPSKSFQYEYDGKIHYYHPDFLLVKQNMFIEIKGDQFFDKNRKMICPYRNKNWTDDQYNRRCELFAAKYQCMILNNVQIIRYKSFCISYIMKTVDRMFGKHYIENFKNIK